MWTYEKMKGTSNVQGEASGCGKYYRHHKDRFLTLTLTLTLSLSLSLSLTLTQTPTPPPHPNQVWRRPPCPATAAACRAPYSMPRRRCSPNP